MEARSTAEQHVGYSTHHAPTLLTAPSPAPSSAAMGLLCGPQARSVARHPKGPAFPPQQARLRLDGAPPPLQVTVPMHTLNLNIKVDFSLNLF